MDQHKRAITEKRINKVIENLQKNNMQAFFVDYKSQVFDKVNELLNDGETVAVGGSMSLFECGIIDHSRSGKYNFLDRNVPELTPEQMRKIYIDSFSADTYICSSNAITENGELYNVDGNSNRVAAICYGPKSVIMVVGINKIVKNIDEAITRVKSIAAPANCDRLNSQTYCKLKGECQSFTGKSSEMTSGCNSPSRICCNYLISSFQRHKDRIKVILVGEEIGY